LRAVEVARYFFHLRYAPDKLAMDREGDEIADIGLVRQHAIRSARKIARTRSHAVRDWLNCSFEIDDHREQHVMRVPFSDVIQGEALPAAR
jgi:uncharacterized protein YqjF (DUF2071 family)